MDGFIKGLYRANLEECRQQGLGDFYEAKAHYKTLNDTKTFVRGAPNYVVYDPGSFQQVRRRPGNTQEASHNMQLSYTEGYGTVWSDADQRRLKLKHPIYKLTDIRSGTFIDFREPEDGIVMFYLFSVPHNKQNSFSTLGIFRKFFNYITSAYKVGCLTSKVLEAPNDGKNDWRFESMGERTRLWNFWRRIGGVPEDGDSNRLWFFTYDEARQIMLKWPQNDLSRVFGGVGRGIWTSEQKTMLAAEFSTLNK